jgi:ApbE superfamily uncharacterized protein (UPF0280 family)
VREPAIIRTLADGRRLHLHDGPIDLIVEGNGSAHAIQTAYKAAARRFPAILDELCGELTLLRSAWREESETPQGRIARRMTQAVAPYARHNFITPMAAVAGAVAEEILYAMIDAAQLDRAYVNNGGDIALHVSAGERYKIGMVERPDRLSLFGSFEISHSMRIRGVATSGWRGRSFSLGIADAVTVLAETAAMADAAATIIANAVDLPGHQSIVRLPANEIAPDSDLGARLVTCKVGNLSALEIATALDAGACVAEDLLATGMIAAAALNLYHETRVVSELASQQTMDIFSRSLPHA